MTLDFENFLESSSYKEIYKILLNYVKEKGNDKKSLTRAMGSLKNYRIVGSNTFRKIINFNGDNGNTLLHHAVIDGHTNSITILFKYGANFLIENNVSKIPLNLAQEQYTKNVLIEGMKKQFTA
ncbi:MAG: hypothetical protein PV340_00320 [Wolbachia sp.]|nr:hypothetical protein [Wolbachia sp.]MDD9336700.1 hypothetical protein [Wolbachia sp.]